MINSITKVHFNDEKWFIKMHGTGNSFILVKNNQLSMQAKQILSKKLCDYNFGVGADGMLFIGIQKITKTTDKAELTEKQPTQLILQEQPTRYSMKIVNRDGSHAEMCGNGLRCFCACIREMGLEGENEFKVNTDAGVKKVRTIKVGDIYRVAIQMGNIGNLIIEDLATQIRAILPTIYIISGSYLMFNVPHLMPTSEEIRLFGQTLQKTINANINFVVLQHQQQKLNSSDQQIEQEKKGNAKIYIRTYERGAGLTLACGTGACASVIVGITVGYLKGRVEVATHGGQLEVWVEDEKVMMDGPAEFVAAGYYE